MAKRRGNPRINVRLDERTIQQLRELSEQQYPALARNEHNCGVSRIVRHVVSQYLAQRWHDENIPDRRKTA